MINPLPQRLFITLATAPLQNAHHPAPGIMLRFGGCRKCAAVYGPDVRVAISGAVPAGPNGHDCQPQQDRLGAGQDQGRLGIQATGMINMTMG